MKETRISAERSPDPIGESIALLIRQRDDFLAQAADIDAVLERMRGLKPAGGDFHLPPPVTQGEFVGRKLSHAFESYLRARKGHKLTLDKVVADLLAGGLDPGLPRHGQKDPRQLLIHNLKILMGNRRELVAWQPDGLLKKVDPRDITLWLAPGADQPPKKRVRKK